MTRRSFLTLLLILWSLPASACFGPKLYIGVEPGVAGDLNFALLSLYIKEKTGVEAVRVAVASKDAARVVAAAEEADLASSISSSAGGVLTLPDGTTLLVGQRVRDDLQFTTVLPALKKLQTLLSGNDTSMLLPKVQAGEGALATVRSWFKVHKAL